MNRLLYFTCVLLCFDKICASKLNIIVFLTDDQDLLLGGMTPMINTIKYIQNEGVTFQNAFVNAPICCPSRSTLLTGRFPHNTGVVNNSVSGNCASMTWRKQLEPFSIAPLLQNDTNNKLFNTFYAGKYLNQYGTKKSGEKNHIPIGWDAWYGLIGNSRYYNYSLNENGRIVRYKNAYLTDVIKSKAVNFLKNNTFKSPIFMMLAPPAPHAPFTPAPRHENYYLNITALRTPAFNYSANDKHWLLRMPPKNLPTNVNRLDKIQQHRFETLLSVDEMVLAVINELNKLNQLKNTYFLYTSDHGYHIGQFNLPWDKRQPYDTDIRVPLFIRGPGIPPKSIHIFPFQSVDLLPTILQMADLPIPDYIDGKSILDQIKNNKPIKKWVKNILIEYHGEGNSKSNDPNCPWGLDTNLAECNLDSWCKCQDSINNTYNCIRHLSTYPEDFIYCEFKDSENFIEAYNMIDDKYQLKNMHKQMNKKELLKQTNILNKLLKCKGKNCRDL